MNKDQQIKIILIGELGVGKSSIILRLVDNKFFKEPFKNMGSKSFYKSIEFENNMYNLELRDTEALERFGSLTMDFYSKSQGILIVFDLTNINSFNQIKKWKDEIDSIYGNDNKPVIFLVGNKSEITSQTRIPFDKCNDLSKNLNLKYFETSAKLADNNIQLIFLEMLRNIVKPEEKLEKVEPHIKSKSKLKLIFKIIAVCSCCCGIPYGIYLLFSCFYKK